jgi:hypothetical protein
VEREVFVSKWNLGNSIWFWRSPTSSQWFSVGDWLIFYKAAAVTRVNFFRRLHLLLPYKECRKKLCFRRWDKMIVFKVFISLIELYPVYNKSLFLLNIGLHLNGIHLMSHQLHRSYCSSLLVKIMKRAQVHKYRQIPKINYQTGKTAHSNYKLFATPFSASEKKIQSPWWNT